MTFTLRCIACVSGVFNCLSIRLSEKLFQNIWMYCQTLLSPSSLFHSSSTTQTELPFVQRRITREQDTRFFAPADLEYELDVDILKLYLLMVMIVIEFQSINVSEGYNDAGYVISTRSVFTAVGIACYSDGCICHDRICPSVCPSVLPSHSGVLSRRMKLRSRGFHRQVG